MDENKKYAELLGIDKPDEWLDFQFDKSLEELSERSEVFVSVLNDFILATGDIKFLIAIKFNHLGQTLMRLTRLFYAIGYMKGKIDREREGKLEQLWKED